MNLNPFSKTLLAFSAMLGIASLAPSTASAEWWGGINANLNLGINTGYQPNYYNPWGQYNYYTPYVYTPQVDYSAQYQLYLQQMAWQNQQRLMAIQAQSQFQVPYGPGPFFAQSSPCSSSGRLCVCGTGSSSRDDDEDRHSRSSSRDRASSRDRDRDRDDGDRPTRRPAPDTTSARPSGCGKPACQQPPVAQVVQIDEIVKQTTTPPPQSCGAPRVPAQVQEDPNGCTRENGYLRDELKDVLSLNGWKGTIDAPLPVSCIEGSLKKAPAVGGSYFKTLGGYALSACSLPKRETVAQRPCVSDDYLTVVYNSYAQAMKCMNINMKSFFPHMNLEARMHVNSGAGLMPVKGWHDLMAQAKAADAEALGTGNGKGGKGSTVSEGGKGSTAPDDGIELGDLIDSSKPECAPFKGMIDELMKPDSQRSCSNFVSADGNAAKRFIYAAGVFRLTHQYVANVVAPELGRKWNGFSTMNATERAKIGQLLARWMYNGGMSEIRSAMRAFVQENPQVTPTAGEFRTKFEAFLRKGYRSTAVGKAPAASQQERDQVASYLNSAEFQAREIGAQCSE